MPEPFTNYRLPSGPDLSFLFAKTGVGPNDLTNQSLQLQESTRASEGMDLQERNQALRTRAQAVDEENTKQQMALRQRDQSLKEILFPLEAKQKGLALQAMLGEIATTNFRLSTAQKDQADKTAREIGRAHGAMQNPALPAQIPDGADPATVQGIFEGRTDKRADQAQTDAGQAEKLVKVRDLELYNFATGHNFNGSYSDWLNAPVDKKGEYRRMQTDMDYLGKLANNGVDLNDEAYADIKANIAAIANNPDSMEAGDYKPTAKLDLEGLAQKAVDRKKELAAKDMLKAKTDSEIDVVKARETEKAKARKELDAASNQFRMDLRNMMSTTQLDNTLIKETQRIQNNILLSDVEKSDRVRELKAAAEETRKRLQTGSPKAGSIPLGLPPLPEPKSPAADFIKRAVEGLK